MGLEVPGRAAEPVRRHSEGLGLAQPLMQRAAPQLELCVDALVEEVHSDRTNTRRGPARQRTAAPISMGVGLCVSWVLWMQ